MRGTFRNRDDLLRVRGCGRPRLAWSRPRHEPLRARRFGPIAGTYATIDQTNKMHMQGVAQGVAKLIWILAKCWSEWQDLNLRPPRPERGALPD